MTEDLNHDFVEPYHFLGFARVNTMPKTISAVAAAARTRTWPEFYVLPAAAAAALARRPEWAGESATLFSASAEICTRGSRLVTQRGIRRESLGKLIAQTMLVVSQAQNKFSN